MSLYFQYCEGDTVLYRRMRILVACALLTHVQQQFRKMFEQSMLKRELVAVSPEYVVDKLRTSGATEFRYYRPGGVPQSLPHNLEQDDKANYRCL